MRQRRRAFVKAVREPIVENTVGLYAKLWEVLCSFKNEEEERYVDIVNDPMLGQLCVAIEIGRMWELLQEGGALHLEDYMKRGGRTRDDYAVQKVGKDESREVHVLNLYRTLHHRQLKENKKYPGFLQSIHVNHVSPNMLFRRLYTALHLFGVRDNAEAIIRKATEVMLVLIVRSQTGKEAFAHINDVVETIYSLRRDVIHQLDELRSKD